MISCKQTMEMVHLNGIGRFCKCGCGKRIEPITVKRNTFGKNVAFKRLPKNKVFASKYCNDKYHNKKGSHVSRQSLKCQISLNVNMDKKLYREIRIYMKKGVVKKFRIREDQKELWEFLENVVRYRYIQNDNKSLLPNNDIMITEQELMIK